MEIIEILTPQYEAAWLSWAVQYFFLIGLATTAGITAACLVFTPADLAAPVALLCRLTPACAFWHFYAHFTPWSWMSIGAVITPVFMVLTLTFAALWWLCKEGALKAVAILLILSCIGVLLYTGSELMVIRSRPLWHTIFAPINLTLTGWLGALGFMLLIARWLPAAWVVSGLLSLNPSFNATLNLFTTYPSWRSSLIGSIIMALVLVLAMSVGPKRLCTGPYSFICALFVMSAAWVFRWSLLMSVQTVPKYGAGLYLQSLPLGSEGLLGMIGVLGLFIAFSVFVTCFLDRYPSYAQMTHTSAAT